MILWLLSRYPSHSHILTPPRPQLHDPCTTTARTENAVLAAKVKELTEKVKVLTVENASLLAEVEMYRKEAALPNFSKLALGQAPSNDSMMDTDDAVDTGDDFVRSGNGVRIIL